MHCKHCGNQIENDSKFCSFCGGKIDPIGQTIITNQPVTQVQTETISAPPYEKVISEKFVNAFLVIALADFGFSLFWIVFRIIATTVEGGFKIYDQLEPIIKPLQIIESIIVLLLCFLYTKKKEHKTLILILAFCVLAWNIYVTYIKTY